jgi:Bacterial membrane protein YfhO
VIQPTPLAREVGVAILLALILTALFPALVLGGHALFERDLHQMLYGQYASFARAIRAGSFPLWDPWSGFGQPMLANPAAQVLYPPTWLCLLLEPGPLYTVYVYLHLIGGALAIRALARRLGVSESGALLSALCFMLSGPMLSLVNLWHHLAGASLMPLVWLAATDVRRQPGPRPAILWGGAMGLQVLAGSFDMCVLTLVLTGAFWLLPWEAGRTPIGRQHLMSAAVAGAVALALAAGLLIPLLEVWQGSAREALGESVRTSWSLHPMLLLQLSLPLFPQALPLPAPTRAVLFDGREPFLASVYLGITTLPIVATALLPKPRRPALFLALAVVGAAAVALGRHGLAYPALVELFPPLGSLRYPSKVTVVIALAWALLAGVGLDAIREAGRERRLFRPGLAIGALAVIAAGALAVSMLAAPPAWLVFAAPPVEAATVTRVTSNAALRLFAAAGFGLATLATLLRDSSSIWPGAGLVCLAGLDLGLAHHGLSATAPARWFATPPAVVSHLPSEGFVRIHAWDYLTRVVGKPYRRAEPVVPSPEAPRDVPAALATALARNDFLSPPTAARFGLHGAFDRDWLGLQPRGVRNLGLIFQALEETPDLLRLLRVGGVTHVVALHREGLETLEPVATETSPFAGPVHVMRVPDPLPRAYAVGGARVADGLAALQMLLAPDVEPRFEVVLPSGTPVPAPPSFASDVRISDARPDRLRIEAVLQAPGFVVLLDAWDASWRALVDSREVEVHRANVGFRAVGVPAGTHVVELFYRPAGLWTGLAMSAGAALLVLAALGSRLAPWLLAIR